jgi:hypothetical protein
VTSVIRIRFEGDQLGPKFKKNLTVARAQMNRSLMAAAGDFVTEFLKAGRANIRSAGNFKSARWMQGLFARVSRGGGNIVIGIGHEVKYWIVFQERRVIQGKPLLWIPFDFALDAQGVRARDYPGRLFRVDRGAGKAPLLMSADDKQPKYFGKPFVRIPKKFRVFEIARGLARNMNVFYKRRMALERKGKK